MTPMHKVTHINDNPPDCQLGSWAWCDSWLFSLAS